MPDRPHILFSVSKDQSARIWNFKTDVLVAVFGGDGGHRDEILGLDIHMNGDRMITCSMDNSIKIWNLADPKLTEALAASEKFWAAPMGKPFKSVYIHYPVFSTSAVHKNYVDCVRYVGDLVLSKSTENVLTLWKPGDPGKTFGV